MLARLLPSIIRDCTLTIRRPGGYAPALSEIIPAIERNGLMVTDIEVLRMHHAETLKAWRKRFHANRPEIAKLYGERFCRIWEFYLAGAEVVFQIQIAKHIDSLPVTRDYMLDREQGFVGAAQMRQLNKAA
jgi:cyclopropane-fatty-acyl-phospholipid synthase